MQRACKNTRENTHPGEDFVCLLSDTADTDYRDTDTRLGSLWFLHL